MFMFLVGLLAIGGFAFMVLVLIGFAFADFGGFLLATVIVVAALRFAGIWDRTEDNVHKERMAARAAAWREQERIENERIGEDMRRWREERAAERAAERRSWREEGFESDR